MLIHSPTGCNKPKLSLPKVRGSPHTCSVTTFWALIDCHARPHAGSWILHGMARMWINVNMGSQHVQGIDLVSRLPCHALRFDLLKWPIWAFGWSSLHFLDEVRENQFLYFVSCFNLITHVASYIWHLNCQRMAGVYLEMCSRSYFLAGWKKTNRRCLTHK